MHDFPEGETDQQLSQWPANRRNVRKYLLVGNYRDVVLGEIHSRFQGGDQLHELLFCRLQTLGNGACELARGNLRLVKRLRFDQIAHRLSLREINAAIEKSAHGELTRFSETSPTFERQLHGMPK